MEYLELLQRLCAQNAVSGREEQLFQTLRALSPDGCRAAFDRAGNFSLSLGSDAAAHKILLCAHCDRIGLVVSDFYENGFLKVAAVGGIDVRTLLASRVTVHGSEDLPGVFATVPPHLTREDDKNNYPAIDALAVDVGLAPDLVFKKVRPGDFISFAGAPAALSGSRITGAGLDNRAGCAVLLKVLETLAAQPLKNTCVTALFSAQEEVGCRGAKAAQAACQAQQVLVVDTSFAAFPGCPAFKTGKMGGGVMLGVSPILSRTLTDELKALSERREIPLQLEILAGTTGTDADALTLAPGGVHCALLSLPLKNMHSAVEIVDSQDLAACQKLIELHLREVDEQ